MYKNILIFKENCSIEYKASKQHNYHCGIVLDTCSGHTSRGAKALPDTGVFKQIYRTDGRTTLIADFLSKGFGYTVIDLVGEIQEAKLHNLPIVPYNKPK